MVRRSTRQPKPESELEAAEPVESATIEPADEPAAGAEPEPIPPAYTPTIHIG